MATAEILIVEDESIIAHDIASTLESLGYKVCAVVPSGREAIAMVQQRHPTLVLMDIVLKGDLDGVQTASEIRTIGDVPIVYLTAYANEEVFQRATITAPFGYIIKPFEERELHTAVEVALYRHRIEAAEREQRTLAEALRDTAAALNSTLDTGEVLKRILANAGRVVPHDAANIMLVRDGVARVALTQGYERSAAEAVAMLRVALSQMPPLERLAAGGPAVVIPDTRTERTWAALPETQWVRSWLGVPICARGQVRGFLNLDSATPGLYTQAHAERLQAFADQAAVALTNAEMYAQLQRLQEKTVQRNVQLEATLEAKDELLQNVSHELRTPLTHIRGFAEALLQDLMGDLTDEQREVVATIVERSDSLTRLVNGLLTLETFTAADLQLSPTDPDLLLAEAAGHWAPVVGDRVTMRVTPEPGPQAACADYRQLLEVLDQLLNNALKFTPDGGEIVLAAEPAPGVARLTVSNTGPGIDSDKLEKIFERFYQADAYHSRRKGGAGIGLAIVRKIVEAHGGRVWAESPGRLGSGATFVVEVPAAA